MPVRIFISLVIAGAGAALLSACTQAPGNAPTTLTVIAGPAVVARAPRPVVKLLAAKPVAVGVDFERQVKPFLVRYCYDCHGPMEKHPPGGVNMANKKSVMGAIKPGSPFTSLLFKEIWSGRMPPRRHIQPTTAEVAMMQQWISEGANWPDVPAK